MHRDDLFDRFQFDQRVTAHYFQARILWLQGFAGQAMRVVENGPPLDRLMVESAEGQPMVRVGLDEDRALSGCSLVCYPLPGTVRGGVGVLGPLRMNYARALAVVDAVGSRVASYL